MSRQFIPNNRIKRNESLINRVSVIRFFIVVLLAIVWIVSARSIFMSMSAAKTVTSEIAKQAIDLTTPKTILIERQNALQEQNELLQQQLAGMQLVEDENASLRKILDYPKLPHTFITARVISKSSQSIYDRIMIDRGTQDGVVLGDRIIAGENSFIATIDSVTETTAEGALISGSFWKGDAVITRLGITVPVEGKGSGNFELHIPRDLEVRDGDVMTLPGFSDFIFGIIKTVQFDERDPYQTVLARTPVNVQELKFVRVIK